MGFLSGWLLGPADEANIKDLANILKVDYETAKDIYCEYRCKDKKSEK